MQQVFICSPYREDIKHNVKVARDAGRLAARTGYVPIIPHLVYPQFLRTTSRTSASSASSLVPSC